MSLQEVFDNFYGTDDEEEKAKALRINNQLLNVWIKAFFERYWNEVVNELSEDWLSELLAELRQFNEYLKWEGGYPYIKDDNLTNVECIALWSIIENCNGIDDFSIWDMTRKINVKEYIAHITKHKSFPSK